MGEPLGSEEFVSRLERIAERRLRVWKPGRPRVEKMVTLAGQMSLFGGMRVRVVAV